MGARTAVASIWRSRICMALVPGHRGIDELGPHVDSTGERTSLREAVRAEEEGGVERAHPVVTDADDVVLGIELVEIVRELIEREQARARKPADLELLRPAHVDEHGRVARVEARLQLLGPDFELGTGHATAQDSKRPPIREGPSPRPDAGNSEGDSREGIPALGHPTSML